MQDRRNYYQFLIYCSVIALSPLVSAQPGSTTFSYTGAVQTFTVPCTDTITVKAWAGGGSGGGADSHGGAVGGAGACVVSTFVVFPGQILTIIVGGGAGPGGNHVACNGGGVSGWGNGVIDGGTGGGAGCSGTSGGGGGGGAGSGLYNGATVLLVAGGGGGGSGGGQFSSGATGGGGDVDGNPSPGSCSTPGLTGASGNGIGTIGLNKGGGDGGGGGAGGGGYLGGTGGGVATGCDCGACGGGGGSSFSSGINTTIYNGNGQTAGNSTDPSYTAGVGVGGGTSSAGGNGAIVITYNLDPTPVASFSSIPVCFNTPPIHFTDLSTSATTWAWNFGDPTSASNTSGLPNPSHTYTAAGNFTATLTVTNALGCTNSIPQTVTVNAVPAVKFSSTTVCLNNPSLFTDLSTLNAAPITNWSWNFGEPSSGVNNLSTMQNPPHTYGTAGSFQVSLYSISPAGCKDSITNTVFVNPLPVAKALAPTVCFPAPVIFSDKSTIVAGGLLSKWSWNFDDPASGANNISTNQDTAHIYTAAGTYNVLLTVTSDSGCQSQTTFPVTVNPKPAALFTVANACSGSPLSFTDASTVTTGTITNYNWSFGDGAFSLVKNPNHTYADSINQVTYVVTLIVTSSGGCKDTLTTNAIAYPLPVPGLVDTTECFGVLVPFTSLSTVTAPATITAWSWNFGDPSSASNTSTDSVTTHNYTAPGTYTITLTVTTNDNCIAKISNGESIVYPLPKVAFTPTNICQGIAENFVDQSSVPGPGGSIAAQIWLYSDGAFDTIPNPSHIFNTPGQDSVKLYVETNNGCIDSLTKPVTVNPVPVANFTGSQLSGCQNYCLNFTDASTIATGTFTSSWDFGDGGPGSGAKSPPRCYSDTGHFTVTLFLTSDQGCLDTLTKPNMITVFPLPKAAFKSWQSVETIIDPNVQFTNASSADVTKWFWYFGDGDSINPNEINPLHMYPNITTPEIYTALLKVVNGFGCTDTVSHIIIIGDDWTFYIPNSFTPNGDGKNETFNAQGVNLLNYNMKIFDRWGNLIFITQDINSGWDGRANHGSDIAQQDVYVWQVSFKDILGKTHNEVGNVTLIR
jgi:gliding motility-associated-like protein